MKIKTEFTFSLPEKVKPDGTKVKTKGIMKLVTVKDIIDIKRDMRVKNNPSYYYVLLLTRAVKQLGDLKMVNAGAIEKLPPEEFSYLVDLFNEINYRALNSVPVLCDNCGHKFIGDMKIVGEQ